MQSRTGGQMPYRGGSGYVARSSSSGLYDVLELILDKGLVIDVYVRVSVIGIEILTVDARVVIASVDTYLRFAEAVNRLDLTETELAGLPELQEKAPEKMVERKIEDVKEKPKRAVKRAEKEVEGPFETLKKRIPRVKS